MYVDSEWRRLLRHPGTSALAARTVCSHLLIGSYKGPHCNDSKYDVIVCIKKIVQNKISWGPRQSAISQFREQPVKVSPPPEK